MNILLVHPDDCPLDPPWSRAKWDAVLDLGVAGQSLYRDWSQRLNCPVYGLNSVARADDSIRLRELMDFARGRVVDDYGLDWWDLNSVFFYQQFEQIILLADVARQWPDPAKITVTRPCFQASVLSAILGDRVTIAERAAWSCAMATVKHYGRVLGKFSLAQLGEILGDKYDPGYSVRRRFAARPECTHDSVVLVPSAYVNASKIVAAYARMVPEKQFLLVATRRSATLLNAPSNMRMVSLASYAQRPRDHEFQSLAARWSAFVPQMQAIPELALFDRAGGFRRFPRLLAAGIAVRDAWRRVFEHHDISAVFCGDEGNPYICIPMLLARQRGIGTIAVHHGALDGRFHWKSPTADLLLAKSKMEADYLTRVCGVARERVVMGAAASPSQVASMKSSSSGDIVVFSEPYEIYGGRSESIYRDLLPPLCRLARQERRRVVLKLHPFESLRDRRRLVNKILQEHERAIVDTVSGPLTPALLSRTWFGITVQSTVATECAVAGIPCFLCEWQAEPSLGYARQFARFGAGVLLRSPGEIVNIPQLLAAGVPRLNVEGLSSPLSPESLRNLLGGVREASTAAATG